MAGLEISALPPLAGADLQTTDVLAVVDLSAAETKKITATDLVLAGLGTSPIGIIDPNIIDWSRLLPSLIDGSVLIDLSVTTDKLDDLSVTAGKLAVDSVYTAALQDDCVTSLKIANAQILARHIGAGEIETAALDDFSVTSDKTNFAANSIDAAFLLNDSVTDVQIAPGAIGSTELALNSVGSGQIVDGSIITPKYADLSITVDKLEDLVISEGKLGALCVTTPKIFDEAVTAEKLAVDSVTAEKILDGIIDDSKIITEGISRIAVDAISNASLADNAVATGNIQNLAVTNEKIAPGISGLKISDATLTSIKYATGSVDGNALALDSIADVHIQNGAVTDEKISEVNGSKLVTASVTGAKFDPLSFSGGLTLDGGVVVHTNAVIPATHNGLSFDAQGHITATSPLSPAELPLATTTTAGAVSVPPAGGLVVDDAGSISIATAIAPGSVSGITYDEHGNITATRALEADDLPISTEVSIGAVRVPTTNSNPILIDDLGNLTYSASPLTPGTYASITTNQYGAVIDGNVVLSVDQVPGIDASKIISGTFSEIFIGENAITPPKINDYATCLMQEDFPGTGDFLGQFWYTPSTAQLRVYARGSGPQNVWTSVGFGNLQQQNLRVGFTYDATTATVINLTPEGIQAGLVVGSPIPEPTDELSGMYGVCVEGGNAITVKSLTGEVHTPGDWILCLSAAEGWVHIDVTSGGGGGGGATVLNDLLDVTISGLSNEQVLQYNSTQLQWVNVDLPPTIDKLNDLSDVNAVPTAAGDFLTWNGTDNWVSTNVIDCGTF